MNNIFGPNEIIITPSAFAGTKELLEGTERINPENFYNLCSIIEASTLYSRLKLIAGWSLHGNPLFDALYDKEAISYLDITYCDTPISITNPLLGIGLPQRILSLRKIAICDFGSSRGQASPPINNQLIGWTSDICDVLSEGGVEKLLLRGEQIYTLEDQKEKRAIHLLFYVAMNRLALKHLQRPLCTNVLIAPFSSVVSKNSINSTLYPKISSSFGVDIERIYTHSGVKPIYIPPVTALVLERSRSREDIPSVALQIREEFALLRKTAEKYEVDLANAQSIRERLELFDELEEAWNLLIKKEKRKRTRLILRTWELIKSGKPVDITKALIDKAIEKNTERKIVARIEGYFDLWAAIRGIRYYDNLIYRVFRERFDGEALNVFSRYANVAEKELFPRGRNKLFI
jgi:hypothetical protein